MARVRKQADWPKGKVVTFRHRSRVLEGNPWEDPVERDFPVYLPANYSESGKALPALWDLAAYTNTGPGHLNWRNQGETLVQRLDRLIGQEAMPPVIVPMPDCYNSLGGNQYVNSSAVGAYADYLNLELVPFLTEQVNVIDDRNARGAFGKSSGAYGALVLAMRYPDTWGGAAAHAADCGFDTLYRPEFPAACQALAEYEGDINRFLQVFWNKRHLSRLDFPALMVIAMAASYDPDDEQPDQVQLPFDLHTCELKPDRWERWLAHDPLNLVEKFTAELAGLRCLYIDVGNRDQYNIQYGTRALVRKLEKLGVRHHFEEFEGTHSNLDWRLDTSLPMLARALSEQTP